ncbi:MAG TPA: tripartite tricarboxylate transporter substrate binding protein [Burkholderiales bacterium]|nr:tripartite tricarboxylate transporter substrate binding protein [Burkholderiales bacterium]
MRKSKWLAMIVFACGAHAAEAQTYPVKPVHFIVPGSPGSFPDVVARMLGERLGKAWQQAVVVDNRPGAATNLGTAQAAKAAPDGYTLLVAPSAIAINATLWPNPGYDLRKDFVGVIDVATSPLVIVAGAKFPGTTLRETIDKAKAGELTFASPGMGTAPFLSADYLFRVVAKGNVTHVPYKGGGSASIAAALAGEVDVLSIAVAPALSLIKSGRLRALAVTGAKRFPELPDVPTVAESGFPGFEHYVWIGIFAPAGTPAAIVSRVNADIGKLLSNSDFRERLSALACEPVGGSPQSFDRYIESEIVRWAKLVKETGVKPE